MSAVSISEIMGALPDEQRAAIEARAAELILQHKAANPYAELLASLQAERNDVCDRLARLCQALYDGKLDGVDKETLVLIRAQRDIMTDYVDVLDERISRLKEKM